MLGRPSRRAATDCKPVGICLSRFDSYPQHQSTELSSSWLGYSPVTGIRRVRCPLAPPHYPRVAQLVEQSPVKGKVTGSSPVLRATL